ncbi:MAG: type II toxin-antitoxin system HicA family toxin [Bryobacteraceae bacterium]
MGRLKPQPFRKVKRRLEAAGFVEVSQKGSHVKFVRRLGQTLTQPLCRGRAKSP